MFLVYLTDQKKKMSTDYMLGNAEDTYNEERVASRNAQTQKKRRNYYPSNVPQSLIVNAVTGVPYPYQVGSKEQSLLYKIVDATGTCDASGFVIKARKGEEDNVFPNPNTNHLFFDSPEQCMTHLRLTIAPTDVARWHESHRPYEQLPV